MKKITKHLGLALLASCVVIINGCADVSKQSIGAVSGGVIGGALGSTVGKGHGNTAATIAGTVIGGVLGGAIGKSMDDVDKMKMQQALETSHTNQTTTWVNPDNKTQYAVTPNKTYSNNQGVPCRDFTTRATINGQSQYVHGTACRVNGKWVIQN